MTYFGRMSASSSNPLLEIDTTIPFDRIRADHVEDGMSRLMAEADSALSAIENAGDPRTYQNTLGALDVATEQLDVAMTAVGHLESVASTPELRTAYNKVKPEVNSFYAGIPLRPKLWHALKAFAKTNEGRSLTGTKKRFLEKTLDEFRRHGADLGAPEKKRLQEISRKLAELTSRFSQNVLDATSSWELLITDEAKLAGLPPSAIDAARASAESKGQKGFRFTLQAPSLIPVLTYLDDREIRQQVYVAYNTRSSHGQFDNTQIIVEVLALRAEKAKILGYENFGDLVLADRMAKNSATARAFVQDLTERTRAAFERETRELVEFAARTEGDSSTELMPWDVGYYSEKQRRELYDFDEEALRPYFPLDRAVAGLFSTAERLYGVSIRENATLPTWHADVRAYDLFDDSGEHLASFYADFFPRDEKRGGAWMNGLLIGTERNGKTTPHLGLICTNVTPPLPNKPALLTHQEVTTLFHEFGHLLHHCLTRVDVRSLAGTNVAWDFVELPSQIMENWCWERGALNEFARHFETQEAIPDDLFEKMTRARTYREASATMRQLSFATVDMALHLDYRPEKDGDLLVYAKELMQPYAPTPFPEGYAMIASFTHLFASSVGYAAGYYSYKWAEVLDADAFTRFRDHGVFSTEIGSEFRDKILARGDSDDPMALYRSFMGREPKLDALLERSGLIPAPAVAGTAP